MPSPPQAPSPAPARRGHPVLAAVIIVAGLGLIGWAMWAGQRHWRENTMQGIAAGIVSDFGKDLPKDYGNGLVLERITLEGRDIVMIIRSHRMDLESAARVPDVFAQVKAEEKQMLMRFCGYHDVREVLARGMVIKRRFLDTRDQLFFEVSLTAQDCAVTG